MAAAGGANMAADYNSRRASRRGLKAPPPQPHSGGDWRRGGDGRTRWPIGGGRGGTAAAEGSGPPYRVGAAPAMLAVKVKVEKPDLEAASARSRLDAVLQGLLERGRGPREPMEEEGGKAPGDTLSKEASPSAPGKRPSGRFSQQRRKKRREAEEGLPDPAQQRPNTYVIKLFDRSVELGQFPEGTPLYPVCRAWMRNCPAPRALPPAPPPPRPEGAAGHAGKGEDIYELPPPAPPGPPRIPSPLGPEEGAPPPDQLPDPAPSRSSLIYKNMERWKRVRQRWQEAGQRQQQRYGPSLRLLRLIYERQ